MRPANKSVCSVHMDSERGSVSVLFLFLFLPFLCMLFSVILDLVHFCGIQDELQRIVDQEACEGMTQGHTVAQAEKIVRTHMMRVKGMALISSVRVTRTASSGIVEAQGQYHGITTSLVRTILGKDPLPIDLHVRAEVRIQPLTAVVILDRSVALSSSECTDSGLRAAEMFVDRIVDSWSQIEGVHVYVGISPGLRIAVEALSADGDDGISRCRALMGDHLLDVSGVKGVLGDGPFSATEVGYAASLLVQSMLAARPSELGVVIYIVGRSAYERGYPAEVNTHVQRAIIGDYQRVDFYTLVLDEDKSVTIHPSIYTAHGGVYRELALTAQELQGAQLYGTAVKMVTDRVALER